MSEGRGFKRVSMTDRMTLWRWGRIWAYHAGEDRGRGEGIAERLLVSDAVLDNDNASPSLVHARRNLLGNARLVDGLVGADNVVELEAGLGDRLDHYAGSMSAHSGRHERSGIRRTLERFHQVLAVVLALNLEAIGLDGVVVGAGDDGEPYILVAAEDEGIERADTA